MPESGEQLQTFSLFILIFSSPNQVQTIKFKFGERQHYLCPNWHQIIDTVVNNRMMLKYSLFQDVCEENPCDGEGELCIRESFTVCFGRRGCRPEQLRTCGMINRYLTVIILEK